MPTVLYAGDDFPQDSVLLRSVSRMPDLAPDLTDGLRRNFMTNDPGPKGRREGAGSEGILARGMYCCQVCTPQYERALRGAAPGPYRRQEAKFMSHLEAWRERGGGPVRRRWPSGPINPRGQLHRNP